MSKTISKTNNQESQLKILVIDDNEQITKLISSFLDMSNHSCTVVNDGKEGLELMKTEHFDSIVLDLAMPDFDGHDIIKTIQKDDLLQLKKIIILTASSISDDTINEFKHMGISAILQKPVDIDHLLSSITDISD